MTAPAPARLAPDQAGGVAASLTRDRNLRALERPSQPRSQPARRRRA
ncbi:hypothetical protein GLE_1476 [Lysobacter enzymogenes]|uniref:Uncharacterized protein n=1 Tax=Lysobacter enzymogenes TaxID=69 RepID=A0A0S2DEA4_LYSEN|nr:hypothetical protein GLE_1476 [Lysobacter enzymogenes]